MEVTSWRNATLDYARVFAAFLVIYGHLYTPNPDNLVRVFIYQFHMAFFFVVSGMLHKYNGTIQLKKYAKGILIPVISFAVLFFLMTGMLYHIGWFGYKEALPNTIVDSTMVKTYWNYLTYSIKGIIIGKSMLNGPCWFLIALFYCKVALDCIERKRPLFFMLWVILFLMLCIFRHRYLFISNAVMAMPFYYLGYMLKPYVIHLNFVKGIYKLEYLVISFIIVVCILKLNGSVSMWSIKFGNLSRYISIPLFYMGGISGSIMMLSFSSLFKKSRKYVTYMANSLISILGLQIPCIFIIDNLFGYDLEYCISLGIAAIVMGICVLGHYLIISYCPILIGKK